MEDSRHSAEPTLYNYPHFDQHIAEDGEYEAQAAFRDSVRAGQRAENFRLVRLDDEAEVALSDLWRAKPLVMEFGSFT